MELVIFTKFHVNRMNCVESRRGVGPIEPLPLEASCSYFFFFEAFRVNNSRKYKNKAVSNGAYRTTDRNNYLFQ